MRLVTQNDLPRTTPEARTPDRAAVRLHAAIGAVVRLAGGVWAGARSPAEKRMQVLETLALGARKQLLLVCCDGERFLVGTGADQVQTIVRLGRGAAADNDATTRRVL
jgi:flagellar biogenesis protein FliO